MIEKLLGSELSRRRYRRFKKERRAVFGFVVLSFLLFLSLTAEVWSNSKPIVLYFHGQLYFPVLKNYHPSVFGINDQVVTDYRQLSLGDSDWKISPPIAWDPLESNKTVEKYPSNPTNDNIFGTDDRGRDILSRTLYGFRYSFMYALGVWLLTVILGVFFGGLMGYFGGWTDLVGQRVVEVLSSVPILFLLIILVSIFEPSITLLILLTSVFSWISLSYYVRGEFLKNRKQDYVEAAKALGAGHLRIIFGHVLPNSLVPIITFSPFIIASHILGLASLDYLGFGLQPPTPSWGELLGQAKNHFTIAWWLAVFPGGALFLTLVMLGLVGEGVRKAFDERA